MVLLVTGALAALRSRRPEPGLLVLFTAVYLLFISALSLRWERWMAAALPVFALLAASGLGHLADWGRRRAGFRLASLASLIILVAVVGPPAAESVAVAGARAGEDTRTLAGEWIQAHLPIGSRILLERYTPELPRGEYETYFVNDGVLRRFPSPRDPRVHVPPDGDTGRLSDARQLDEFGIEFVVLGNLYNRYLAERERYESIVQGYEAVIARGTLIYEITPNPGQSNGPEIRIYRLAGPRAQ
jgi:hypothetical protein